MARKLFSRNNGNYTGSLISFLSHQRLRFQGPQIDNICIQMKHCAKFRKQLVKTFGDLKLWGFPGSQRVTLLKYIYIYIRILLLKNIYYKNTLVLECNIVSCFKQTVKNFRRFKILGALKGLRNTFCLYIF